DIAIELMLVLLLEERSRGAATLESVLGQMLLTRQAPDDDLDAVDPCRTTDHERTDRPSHEVRRERHPGLFELHRLLALVISARSLNEANAVVDDRLGLDARVGNRG